MLPVGEGVAHVDDGDGGEGDRGAQPIVREAEEPPEARRGELNRGACAPCLLGTHSRLEQRRQRFEPLDQVDQAARERGEYERGDTVVREVHAGVVRVAREAPDDGGEPEEPAAADRRPRVAQQRHVPQRRHGEVAQPRGDDGAAQRCPAHDGDSLAPAYASAADRTVQTCGAR